MPVRICGELSAARCVQICRMISGGEIPIWFAWFRFGGDVADTDGEVLTQARGEAAGPGQPEGSDVGEHVADLASGPDPRVGADLPGLLQERQAV
jgi:hypothetical protein